MTKYETLFEFNSYQFLTNDYFPRYSIPSCSSSFLTKTPNFFSNDGIFRDQKCARGAAANLSFMGRKIQGCRNFSPPDRHRPAKLSL